MESDPIAFKIASFLKNFPASGALTQGPQSLWWFRPKAPSVIRLS